MSTSAIDIVTIIWFSILFGCLGLMVASLIAALCANCWVWWKAPPNPPPPEKKEEKREKEEEEDNGEQSIYVTV